MRIQRTDAGDFEQVVFAEVLVPETLNSWADYWTKPAIVEAAYAFMREGFGIDVEHDNENVEGPGGVYVVESFIAREGDSDFIPGSWVVAMKIEDEAIWQKVLDKEINGYSYEALVHFLPITVTMLDTGTRSGQTLPADDGHVHTFVVFLDDDGYVSSGATDVVDGHHHKITRHVLTGTAAGHSHRYTVVKGSEGL